MGTLATLFPIAGIPKSAGRLPSIYSAEIARTCDRTSNYSNLQQVDRCTPDRLLGLQFKIRLALRHRLAIAASTQPDL